jgi:hypothetical protein
MEIMTAFRAADKLSNACQSAYARGNMAEGARIEALIPAAERRYYDLCDAHPELAPRQNES